MADRWDVAIVGGGAAGIAAARRLAERQISAVIVEALPRLGGRAHTATIAGFPLDLGCGWMHSAERNPLTALADRAGHVVDRSEAAWGRQLRGLAFKAEAEAAAWAAFARLGETLRTAPPRSDRVADALAPAEPWRPFLDAISSYVNGAELERLSAADAVAYDDAASENNWRLPDGYGTFVSGLGAGCAHLAGTRVTALTEADGVTLETDRGTVRAEAAIVTVSTAVLCAGAIRFSPPLDEHLDAASRLPLGLANKVYLSLADAEAVPAESHLLGRADAAATGSYYLRPFGRPLVECFFGGELARELERAGDEAAVAFARDELGALLGASFARGLAPLVVTAWGREPTFRGSYSHALPGHAGARAVLARPPSARLCFAGEAVSRSDYSTAHGAWASGLAAADFVARGLGATR